MQFLTLLGLAAGALALPTQQIDQRAAELSFNKPWILSNVKLLQAKTGNSSLSFHFSDTNTGLALETDCLYSAPNVIGSAYNQCSNDTVAFYYDGTSLEVERAYTDPALGEYPYDQGVAFATGHPTWNNHTTPAGKVSKVKKLSILVNSQIAK